MSFKLCGTCKELKELDEFYKLKSSKDGRNYYCISCVKLYRQKGGYNRYSFNPEKAALRQSRARKSASNKKYERQFRAAYLRKEAGKAGKLLSGAKSRASKKSLEFSLTREWVLSRLNTGICEATGVKFDYTIPKGRTRAWSAPSIDRKDNTKGYTEDNCWVVCLLYNVAKGEGTVEELLNLAKLIVEKDKHGTS